MQIATAQNVTIGTKLVNELSITPDVVRKIEVSDSGLKYTTDSCILYEHHLKNYTIYNPTNR